MRSVGLEVAPQLKALVLTEDPGSDHAPHTVAQNPLQSYSSSPSGSDALFSACTRHVHSEHTYIYEYSPTGKTFIHVKKKIGVRINKTQDHLTAHPPWS